MRILHTSDWHLGQQLGRQDLSDDLTRQLQRIAGYLVEYHVDVMLVTGDIFSDICYSRPARMQAAIQAIKESFGDFLARDGTILAISGNHDRLQVLDTFRGILQLASPRRQSHAIEQDGNNRLGTFHLFTGPANLNFPDKRGQCVQFQIMPYPTPPKYMRDEDTNYRSPEERNRLIQQCFIKTLQQRAAKYVQPELPAVLLSHIQVRGIAVQGTTTLSDAEIVLIEPSAISAMWAYAAFGHIHRPQAISDRPNVRYAGSILRLDAGEAHDDKSCVLFEIGTTGLIGEPQELPLPCPPIEVITIADPSEVATLRERYPHAAETLAKITLNWEPSWDVDRERLRQEICAIFPCWYAFNISPAVRATAATLPAGDYQLHDVSDTVRGYARQYFTQEPDREALLSLLDELLTEEA